MNFDLLMVAGLCVCLYLSAVNFSGALLSLRRRNKTWVAVGPLWRFPIVHLCLK